MFIDPIAIPAVFFGGALGGATRWWISSALPPRKGTFTANAAASMVLGFTVAMAPLWAVFIGTGFAGALSTWSTLAKEAGMLLKERKYARCAKYLLWTLSVGVAFAGLGVMRGNEAF
ncbi:CrcB family protein [Corynebacterium sp. CCUG 18816]|uniref:fluoride efflux transporter FluC n=1 Tax=Corynebacterium pseudogenitalium TaxID=38303 RepID=UPI002108B459|nr:CrcB family protein [Corynebacterium pseudogenitalium]